MKLNSLAKVSDSLFGENADILKKKKSDALKGRMKAKIRKALKDDLDNLEEVTSEEVENSSPEEVLEVVIEVLGEVAKELATTADSLAKAKTIKAPTLKVGDADWKKAFRLKLMDTDTTEDVIELAKAELAVTDPASVVETVIEVLDDVIENLAEG